MLFPKKFIEILALFAALVLIAAGIACGGSYGNSMNPPASGTAMTQFRIGDAPSDRVVSFEVTLNSPLVLTPSGGGANVNVMLTANRLEITHTSGASEPLVVSNIPQGTYTSAGLTIAHPEVTFINSAGVVQKLENNATAQVTVNLNPALMVGASPGVVTIDLNIANSLVFDGSGNVTGFNFTGPSFTFGMKPLGNGDDQEDNEGEIEDLVGMVTNVSGNNFTITLGGSGVQLTFATDANTEFKDGVSNVGSLMNQIVKVEGFTKPDGTLYAKEVEGRGDQGELEGFITTVTAKPATSLTMIVQDGTGSGMDNSKMGEAFAVNVNGLQASKFRVKQGNLDFNGLNNVGSSTMFPFDASTIHAGQRIEVDTDTTIPAAGGTITAEKVNLQQQTLTGSVSAVSGSNAPRTITMTVASDSAFATVSGILTVTVFDQAKSDHRMTVNVGDRIRVRGLVFFTAVNQANMIARRIESSQ
jgi:hypothetical protein